jgi:hypothetical protein
MLRSILTVDKNVTLVDLLEGTSLRCLGHIPLEYLRIRDTGLEAHVNSAASTASQSANNDNTRQAADLSTRSFKVFLNVVDEGRFVRVALDTGESLASGVCLLPGPGLEGESAATKASRPSKGGYAKTRGRVLKELEVQKRSTTAGEAG